MVERSGARGSVERRPLVSVVLITYNHERFIAQAIESVLSQRTSFPFELIITEDASTDRTRDILKAYREEHPDRIRLILSTRNQNDNDVLTRGIRTAHGDLVALLDGDDYWSSPEKLQKQYDFLTAHPECAICFHNALVLYEDGSSPPHPFHLPNPVHRISRAVPAPITNLADIVPGNFMQTCTVMFRNRLVQHYPDWYNGAVIGDWPLHVFHAQHGDIGYIDEVLATYRVHAQGIWTSRLSKLGTPGSASRLIELYQDIDRHTSGRFHESIQRRVNDLHRRAAAALFAAGRPLEATSHRIRYLRNRTTDWLRRARR